MIEVEGLRKKIFSVTIDDCRVDTFTVGGHGGSGKDTSNTGVRITHIASGAVGKATDTRSQAKNKQLAFRRMAETKVFKAWAKLKVAEIDGKQSVEQQVEEALEPHNLRVEGKSGEGKWIMIP